MGRHDIMVKQIINVDNYWRVIVYYNIDYTLLNFVKADISLPVENIDEILHKLMIEAKAVTITNMQYKTSIVIFKKHKTVEDYINSIVHEAEHVKDDMLKYYNVDNSGEPPAYTIGYLVAKMYSVFKTIL